MEVTLTDQVSLALTAGALGVALSFLWDATRIIRRIARLGKAATVTADILFFSACAVIDFIFILGWSDGRVRVFILLSQMFGFTLYQLTLGPPLFRLTEGIIRLVLKIIGAIYRFITRPLVIFYNKTGKLCRKSKEKMKKYTVSVAIKSKKILKHERLVLYNLYTSKKAKKRQAESERETMKRKDEKKKNRIPQLLLIAVIVYGLVSAVKLQFDVMAKRAELADIQSQCSQQQLQNESISSMLAPDNESEYMASIARDQLDYVYPDERIYVDISGR